MKFRRRNSITVACAASYIFNFCVTNKLSFYIHNCRCCTSRQFFKDFRTLTRFMGEARYKLPPQNILAEAYEKMKLVLIVTFNINLFLKRFRRKPINLTLYVSRVALPKNKIEFCTSRFRFKYLPLILRVFLLCISENRSITDDSHSAAEHRFWWQRDFTSGYK